MAHSQVNRAGSRTSRKSSMSASHRTAKTKKKTRKRIGATFFKVFFLTILMTGIVGACVAFGVVYGWIKTAEPVKPDMLQPDNFATIVYDTEGKELSYIFDSENRVWVNYKDIPEQMIKAIIAIEDERFFSHPGIDVKRILSVTFDLLTTGKISGGGSTITQQVIKAITHDTEVTLRRKVVEQWRALQLERVVDKKTILEAYLNLVYFGQGAYGVQTAARVYFDKDVRELTLSECATIAGITNLPSRYDPYINMEASKSRRNIILGKMLELGYISQEEYDAAVAEDIVLKRGLVKQSSIMPYFVEEALKDVKEDLIKVNNMSEEEADAMIRTGGLRIYTTMDSQIQAIVDDVFQNEDEYFPDYVARGVVAEGSVQDPRCQAAMVIIDPHTGEVKAMAGGRGKKEGNLVLNRATQELRQPGSTIKPIAVYAPLLESGQITAATVFDDVPLFLPGYHPTNYGHDYQGLESIRKAIWQSTNVVAVKAWLRLGADASHDFLVNKLGITTIRTDPNDPQNDRNPAMALGGITDGVSVMEMTAAYIPFANKGVMIEPMTYTKVTNASGKEILVKKPNARVVMSEQNAYVMTTMLEDVVDPGSAWQARFNEGTLKGMASAGKTGTTNDYKDKWFIGYTPYYLAGVWYGYSPIPAPFPEEGQQIKIWGDVMKRIHLEKNLPVKKFEEPEGIVHMTICVDSGKLPGPLCEQDIRNLEADSYWHRLKDEVFAKGTEPTEICDQHIKVKICKESGLLATEYCPKDQVEEKVMIKGIDPIDQNYKKDEPNARIYDINMRAPQQKCNIHTGPARPSSTPASNNPTSSPSSTRSPSNSITTPSPSAYMGGQGSDEQQSTESQSPTSRTQGGFGNIIDLLFPDRNESSEETTWNQSGRTNGNQ